MKMSYEEFKKAFLKELMLDGFIKDAYEVYTKFIKKDAYYMNFISETFYNLFTESEPNGTTLLSGKYLNLPMIWLLEKIMINSNYDPVISHIYANSQKLINNNVTDEIIYNYKIDDDVVLNEMLLSNIAGKINKNFKNSELLKIYIDEKHDLLNNKYNINEIIKHFKY